MHGFSGSRSAILVNTVLSLSVLRKYRHNTCWMFCYSVVGWWVYLSLQYPISNTSVPTKHLLITHLLLLYLYKKKIALIRKNLNILICLFSLISVQNFWMKCLFRVRKLPSRFRVSICLFSAIVFRHGAQMRI